MEHGKHLPLQQCAEVDEHVAATDEVEVGERRVHDDVLPREHAHFADGFVDAVAAVGFREKPPQPFRRHVVGDARGIKALPRAVERREVDVRAENLHGVMQFFLREKFHERDGDGIHLLAAGAARNPEADRLIGFARFDQAWEHFFLQRIEHGRVAEKFRDVDEDVAEQLLHFGGMRAQVIGVFAQHLELAQRQTAADAAVECRTFVMGEIHARALAQQHEGFLERPFLAARLRRGRQHGQRVSDGTPRDADEFHGDLRGREHEIHASRRNRVGGHRGVFRRFLVLCERHAARRLHRLQAARAVRAVARENDADGVVGFLFGERFEEMVNRHVDFALRFARGNLQPAAGDAHRLVRRDDVNAVAYDGHVVLGFRDRHSCHAPQQRRQRALVRRVEVLHHHERHAWVRGEFLKQFRHRLQPARRRADGDDGERLFVGLRFGGAARFLFPVLAVRRPVHLVHVTVDVLQSGFHFVSPLLGLMHRALQFGGALGCLFRALPRFICLGAQRRNFGGLGFLSGRWFRRFRFCFHVGASRKNAWSLFAHRAACAWG